MGMLMALIASMVAVGITSYVLPGVTLDGIGAAFLLVVVLGVLNAVIKPILLVFTLPINFLTLGLFTFVINAVVVLLASAVVPGFMVDGFLTALLFGIVLSVVNSLIGVLVKE